MLALEADIQLLIHSFAMLEREVDKLRPQLEYFFIAALQAHHVVTGAVGKFFAFVKAYLGIAVEGFQVGQFQRVVTGLTDFHQVGRQHAELGTPVAHVVGTHHIVTQEFHHPGQCVTNNGGTQVTDMHFLGQIGRGIFHHHPLGCHRADAQLVVLQRSFAATGQVFGGKMNVDEARTGDFHLVGNALQVQRGHHFLRQLTRIGLERLGGTHHPVSLIVTEFRFGSRLDDCRRVRRTGSSQRRLYPLIDQLQNCHACPILP